MQKLPLKVHFTHLITVAPKARYHIEERIMSRSLKKGPFTDFKLAKKVAALGSDDRTIIKTWSRASTISPDFVGRTIACTQW